MPLADSVLTVLTEDHNRQDTSLTAPQPMPNGGDGVDIFTLVINDLRERDTLGMKMYGQPLQAGDGRDHLIDLYQELLDAAAYIRQEIEERKKLRFILQAILVHQNDGADVLSDLVHSALKLLGK